MKLSDVQDLVAEAEAWADEEVPHDGDWAEDQRAWRQGFAAAMQRVVAIAAARCTDDN